MEQLISNDSFLITGGSGMIGSQIKLGIKPSSKELNILIPENIEKIFKKYKPKILLHLAALTDIKKCELKPKLAYEINVKGTLNIVRACDKYKTKLIYMSTCAVFDGKKKKPYNEKDVPCPFNVYGKTKLEGEKFCHILKNYLVVRSGWIFGRNMPPNKFVRVCFEKLTKNKNVEAVSDRVGSPTYAKDLIEKTIELSNKKNKEIIHIINTGTASYYDIGIEIKKIGDFSSSIIPVLEKKEKNLHLRGTMEALKSGKIKTRNWQKALKEYAISFL